MSAYERFPVDAAPETVVSALREVSHERRFAEYDVVDHGRHMSAAGQPRFVAWTLIFGNPAAGAVPLARGLAAAVDIPLRLAISPTERGPSEIVHRDMRSLLADDAADLADADAEARAELSDTLERGPRQPRVRVLGGYRDPPRAQGTSVPAAAAPPCLSASLQAGSSPLAASQAPVSRRAQS
jgi:uncharacterized protein (DUF302 family)